MSEARSDVEGGVAAKSLDAVLADPPWAAKSFIAVGATTVAGFGAWLSDIMSPALARGGASFLGGFLIGWAFRKIFTITLLLICALLALIAALKATGWIQVDWHVVEVDVARTLAWAQDQGDSVKNVLTGYLPPAGAACTGAFFGFRKK